MKKEYKIASVNFEIDLYEKIRMYCDKERYSVSSFINILIERFLNEKSK